MSVTPINAHSLCWDHSQVLFNVWYETEPIEQQHQCRQHLGNEGHLLDLLQHYLYRARGGKFQHNNRSLPTTSLPQLAWQPKTWQELSMESLQLSETIYQVYIHPLQLQGLVIYAASWRYPGDAVSGVGVSRMKLICRVFPIQHKQWKQAQKKIWSFVSSVLLQE